MSSNCWQAVAFETLLVGNSWVPLQAGKPKKYEEPSVPLKLWNGYIASGEIIITFTFTFNFCCLYSWLYSLLLVVYNLCIYVLISQFRIFANGARPSTPSPVGAFSLVLGVWVPTPRIRRVICQRGLAIPIVASFFYVARMYLQKSLFFAAFKILVRSPVSTSWIGHTIWNPDIGSTTERLGQAPWKQYFIPDLVKEVLNQ